MTHIDYVNWHNELRKIRGKASFHLCVGCGHPARDWALRVEHQTGDLHCYVADPDAYQPMCHRCHTLMDDSWRAGIDAANEANRRDPDLSAKRRRAVAASHEVQAQRRAADPEYREAERARLADQAVRAGMARGAQLAARTHCKNGHEFTEENTYYPPNHNRRTCRTCVREAQQRHRNKGATPCPNSP